ncbi:TPA: hypothetical protein DCX16_03140 [bacterium]|nr:hypothetical protein [bacterium]
MLTIITICFVIVTCILLVVGICFVFFIFEAKKVLNEVSELVGWIRSELPDNVSSIKGFVNEIRTTKETIKRKVITPIAIILGIFTGIKTGLKIFLKGGEKNG